MVLLRSGLWMRILMLWYFNVRIMWSWFIWLFVWSVFEVDLNKWKYGGKDVDYVWSCFLNLFEVCRDVMLFGLGLVLLMLLLYCFLRELFIIWYSWKERVRKLLGMLIFVCDLFGDGKVSLDIDCWFIMNLLGMMDGLLKVIFSILFM